jgi:hypothetical protein
MRTVLAAWMFGQALFASSTILIHGRVYTGNPKALWAEAVAITGTKIDAVGTNGEIEKHRTAKTTVIELGGRTVIPGIIDSHTHLWFGALALEGFNFSTPELTISPDDADAFVARIKAYADSHPRKAVVIGRARFVTTPNSTANHELLDRAVPDRPLVIHAVSEHALWVNGKALALAGISDRPDPDPANERFIVRDAAGHPTGVLRETAMQLMFRKLPREPLEEKLAMLRAAAQYLNGFGITSVTNATGDLAEIESYGALRDRKELTIRTRTSFGAVAVNHRLTPQFLADLEQARTKYHDDWVSANLVKMFADGAGSDATAAQFRASADGVRVAPLYEPDEFLKIIVELDKRGFQIMTHAIGDAASRMVLDAYQMLEKTNGARDRRLRIEHINTLTPEDLPRFAKLFVIASMQPLFCCGGAARNNEWQSLLTSGAALAFSSDWPCNWPPDPFAGIQKAVTREARRRNGPVETNLPEERLTVEQAVDAYTRGSAYAKFAEDRTGTLEVGKEADLVELSQDIFHIAPNEIGKTRAVMTMVAGRVVFGK